MATEILLLRKPVADRAVIRMVMGLVVCRDSNGVKYKAWKLEGSEHRERTVGWVGRNIAGVQLQKSDRHHSMVDLRGRARSDVPVPQGGLEVAARGSLGGVSLPHNVFILSTTLSAQ